MEMRDARTQKRSKWDLFVADCGLCWGEGESWKFALQSA